MDADWIAGMNNITVRAKDWEIEFGEAGRNFLDVYEDGISHGYWQVLGYDSMADCVRAVSSRFGWSKSQRAAFAVDAMPQLSENAKERQIDAGKKYGKNHPKTSEVPPLMEEPKEAIEQAGQMFGVGKQYVHEAKKLASDDPETFQQVKNGELTIPQAKRKVYDNRSSHAPEPAGRDNCQSPPYAFLPLLPYIPSDWTIWEPARGEGILDVAMQEAGYYTIATSLQDGQDFFLYEPSEHYDCIVTNPPWSLFEQWVKRCFELGKPFALLMKTEAMANVGIQKLNVMYGDFEHIFTEGRINYKMPVKGWKTGGAMINTHWYTFGFEIGRPLSYLSPIAGERKRFEDSIK